jgi:uncharacterized protein (DUF433 family)
MDIEFDWTDCDLVERIPGKMGGEPVIKGTRVRAETIVKNHDAGLSLEELEENWPELPKSTIATLIDFHRSHSLQPT